MQMLLQITCLLLALGNASAATFDPARVWPDYRARQSQLPLVYERQGEQETFDGGVRLRFLLHSQRWPYAWQPDRQWSHRVELVVPDHPQPGPALLVINNGVRHDGGKRPLAVADDVSPAVIEQLARELGMLVVSIADVPDQPLRLPGDDRLRLEDDLVALSWRRFLDDPAGHAHWPLHVPMAEAAVRAMDLAEREVVPTLAPSFIVAGASKRGWATWLLPLVDDRVSHVVPLVIDMHWQALAPHIQRSYGQRWPIALTPYAQHGITEAIDSPAFTAMMKVVDPYTYLQGPLGARLALPKYLVSASGDDFFTPDAGRFYLSSLPGQTSLRVAPNSDHRGIREHVLPTLLPALRRWRRGAPLAQVQAKWTTDTVAPAVHIQSSEVPVKLLLWTARNPRDRDFRHACGIRYQAQEMAPSARLLALPPAGDGWVAAFVELHYPDGFIATSAAHIYPQDRYPEHPPAQGEGACLLVPEQH